jgi:2-dehydro-3-deoxyphosphooctonate aldolase (KDO 8-P synthase)
MDRLKIIAGNCVLETMETSLKTARHLCEHAERHNYQLIYKSSWRKDNRSSLKYYQGPEEEDVIKIFSALKASLGTTKILTDFHTPEDFNMDWIDNYIDILQIPAYLCMQSSLVVATAMKNKPINIKKGQFIHPSDMVKIKHKIEDVGAEPNLIYVTERGTCFGYRDLVFDPRSIYILNQEFDAVFFDAGHCVRKYGIPSYNTDGGCKNYIPTLAKAAIGSGVDGIFVEVHPDPSKALCDASTQLSFREYDSLILDLLPLWKGSRQRISL